MNQLSLFAHVAASYVEPQGSVSNAALYRSVADKAGLPMDAITCKVPIGKSMTSHSPMKRKIRWYQQTLKSMGILERVEDSRGVWRMTDAGRAQVKAQLTKADDSTRMIGFATDLGIAIWAKCQTVFSGLNEPIHLCLTSPPYPLRSARAYGNPIASEYVDFVCSALDPIVRNLVPGGSIALNISNDIFEPGFPSRSLYVERLVIALVDRLGLHLMERFVWENPNKPPGPIQWASLKRVQLNTGYEPIFWFTNDPLRVRSSNQRVLQPHTEAQKKLIARGGESRSAKYGDGAYTLKPGSFGNPTAGRIPRNVLRYSHVCKSQQAYKAHCKQMGLPANAAPMPLALAKFLIRFMTEPGDLVADPFGGSFTTGVGAQETGRRWIASEQVMEYVLGARSRFAGVIDI